MTDISMFLQTLPLFSGVPKALTESIPAREGCSVCVYEAGACVAKSGDTNRRLGILYAGTAEVEKCGKGAPMLMSVLKKGDLTGASTLFLKGAATANTLYTKEGCTLIYLSETLLCALMRESFTLAENYMRYLTGRIHFLTKRIESIASPTAADKLYRHAKQNAVEGLFCPPRSMAALATTLSLSRASLYRAIDELQAAGLIQCENKTIRIL